MQTLDNLAPGQSGIIGAVANDSGPVKRRLVDMGLTPGTRVTVKKIAPFGDPIEVTLRCYELSLRRKDAAQIQLLPEGTQLKRKKKGPTVYSAPRTDAETQRRMLADHEHMLEEHPLAYDATAHDKREMKIALVGNPNSGKTTLFNALTGSNQYVGNWPGVTVEKKEGKAHIGDREITIVDLPGIYSLSPYSMEEIVSRDFIIGEAPDAIINILDATNIERNLYLTIQLLELERPVVVALNFMDEVEKLGDKIDVERLSQALGVPVVPVTAKTGENLDELLHVAHRQMHIGVTVEPDDLYDNYTHQIHHRIDELIHDRAIAKKLPAHWASIKLLEGDSIVEKTLDLDKETSAKVQAIADEYAASSPIGDRETLIADSRYAFIEKVVAAAVVKGHKPGELSRSDKIDRFVTGKYTAIPVFLVIMLVMFLITFGPLGSFLSDGMAYLIDDCLAPWVGGLLERAGAQAWLTSLITDGVISGVGGVLTFLPQIALLFFFLSLLEDSGYMARAAFVMDRLLGHFGLSGKAFIPMLMGFGCTVPAIMGPGPWKMSRTGA